ncbi:MAG: SRPBCC family protein [Bdellovibrionales bacterium]|nr:SRPBCC family protein [Bdellovibrionales bacterium]
MKKILALLGILVGLVGLMAAISYLLPSHWKVERSIIIQAPPERIYPWVSDFKAWAKWSEFDTADPQIRYTYSGNATGSGSERTWISKSMGNGRQRITYAEPKTGIDFELTMMDTGFHIQGHLKFQAVDGGTQVIWTDSGVSGGNPVVRWVAFFMDWILGGPFERSLEKLKTQVESATSATD